MTPMRTTLAILVTTAVAACGSSHNTDSSEPPPAAVDPRIQVPDLKPEPPDANGFQLIAPKVTGIMPGGSYEYCTWTDKILTEDTYVRSSQGYQSKTGHHIVLFYTDRPQASGTQRLCADDDMATMRFAIGAGGEGLVNTLPGDLALLIPKGSQLVMQHHYLNPTAKPVEAQSIMNVRLLEKGKAFTRAGAIAFVNTSMSAPIGRSSVDVKCKLSRDVKLWSFFPHMHRWGEHVSIDQIHNGTPKRLFDLAWEESFTFHAPSIDKDPKDPFVFAKGDEINIHCQYNNTTDHALGFGLEMCVAFGQTLDPEGLGNIACDDGTWTGF